MAIPVKIADLNTTESSNFPSGSESIGVSLDNYMRATQAILKQTQSKGSDIASGSTIAIPDNGNYFVITGTTTIGAINDSFNGRISVLKFNDIVTLTNSAGLILFGADITTAAGDVLTVVNESAGVYRAISFFKATDDSVTLADTQTLTNKTIVAANNTITTAASGGLAATELDAALAELEAEKATITYVDSADDLKLNLAGGTVTGQIKGITPVADEDLVRKDYVDGISVGEVVQLLASSTTGVSHSNTSFQNAVAASRSFTPTRSGATILLEVLCGLKIANLGSTNTTGYARIAIDGTVQSASERLVSANSAVGGTGSQAQCSLIFIYTSSDTSSHSLTMQTKTSSASAAVSNNTGSVFYKVTEIR